MVDFEKDAGLQVLKGLAINGYEVNDPIAFTEEAVEVAALLLRQRMKDLGDKFREVAMTSEDGDAILQEVAKSVFKKEKALENLMVEINTSENEKEFREKRKEEGKPDFGLTRDDAEKVVGPLPDKVAEQACKFIQALVFNVVQVSPMLSGDLFTGVEYELLMFMCREQVDDERLLRIGKAQCVEHVIRNLKMDTPKVRCGIDGTPGMAVLMTGLTHPTYAQWIQPLFAKLTDHEDKNDVDSDDEDDEDQGNEEDDGEQMIQNLIKDPSLLTLSEGDAIDVSRAIELAFLAHSPEKRTAVIDYFCKNVPKEFVGCLVQYLAEPHDADSVDEDDPLYEKMQNYKHMPFLWSFHSETDLEQTIKANTDNNDEADESDLHIFIADNIKRVRRPLSHEVGMYPISGEDKPDSAGRACVTFLGSELEVASQSALDTLDENFAEAVASDEHETDLITVSVMLISGFDRLPRFREAVKELFLKKHENILEYFKKMVETDTRVAEGMVACGVVPENCLASEPWDPKWIRGVDCNFFYSDEDSIPKKLVICAERHLNFLKKLGAQLPSSPSMESDDFVKPYHEDLAELHGRMVSVLEECGADVNHAFPYRVCYAQKYPSDYAVEKRNPGFLLGVVFDCMLRRGLELDAPEGLDGRQGAPNMLALIENAGFISKEVKEEVMNIARHYGSDPSHKPEKGPCMATYLALHGKYDFINSDVDCDEIGYHENYEKNVVPCTALCIAAQSHNLLQVAKLLSQKGVCAEPAVWASPLSCAISKTKLFPTHGFGNFGGFASSKKTFTKQHENVVDALLKAGSTFVNLEICGAEGVYEEGMARITEYLSTHNPFWKTSNTSKMTPSQREAVVTMMRCAHRLANAEAKQLPVLPTEVWFMVMEVLRLIHFGKIGNK